MCAWPLDWSPAPSGPYADKIIYTSCTFGRADIWMVDANTGVTTNITGSLTGDCFGSPRWSPDGTKISFHKGNAICTMNPDGSDLKQLTNDGFGFGAVWRPDGAKIGFIGYKGSDYRAMMMNPDGSALTPLGGSEDLRWFFDWRQDASGTGYLLHTGAAWGAPGQVRWLEVASPVRLAKCGWNLQWSPAGDRVVFQAWHNILDPGDPNGNSCVWVADADGSAPPVNLSGEGPARPDEGAPTWSPDGSRVAFQGPFDLLGFPDDWPEGWTECPMPSIWVVDPDGVAPPRNLCAPHHGVWCADWPDWGAPPDGSGGVAEKIAYRKRSHRTVAPSVRFESWGPPWTVTSGGLDDLAEADGVTLSLEDSTPEACDGGSVFQFTGLPEGITWLGLKVRYYVEPKEGATICGIHVADNSGDIWSWYDNPPPGGCPQPTEMTEIFWTASNPQDCIAPGGVVSVLVCHPEAVRVHFDEVTLSYWIDGLSDIWTANPDGAGRVNLTAEAPLSLRNLRPQWSPDSTRISYETEDVAEPGLFDLRVMDYDGSNKVELSSNLEYDGWGGYAWSPDSTRIVLAVDGKAYIVSLGVSPPSLQPIPGEPRVSWALSWPLVTPWGSDGELIQANSCALGDQDPILFQARGYTVGGYIYQPNSSISGWRWSTGSMTAAAVWCLRLCGLPVTNYWVQDGLDWLADNYTYTENPGGQGASMHYYYLWSAAKGFMVSDVHALPGVAHRPVEPADQPAFNPGWYYDFSKYLVDEQDPAGSWHGDFTDTFFALMILQKVPGIPYAVEASLSPKVVSVAPGNAAAYTVTVHNLGIEMDSYNLEVLGLPTGWAVTVAATVPDVASDEYRTVPLTVTPPADLALWNDTAYPFQVKVTSQTDPGISYATSGKVIILATATASSRYYYVNELLEEFVVVINGAGLETGTAQSLTSKVEHVQRLKDEALAHLMAGELDKAEGKLKTAINVMQAFANEVEALSGKKMTAEQAAAWLNQAESLVYRLEVLRDQTVPTVLPGKILFKRYHQQPPSTELVLSNPDGTGQVARPVSGSDLTGPRWSPDNSRIAYSSDGNIWVANADGSNATQITSGAETDRTPSWSPRGDEIAFSRLDSNGQPQVHIVTLATQAVRKITDFAREPDCYMCDVFPSWSPAGDWIAYHAKAAEASASIRLVKPDGSQDHHLTDGSCPAFSADGRQIAYRGPRPDSECGQAVWVVNVDGTGAQMLGYRPPLGIGGCYAATSWSPDGQSLAVTDTPVQCCEGLAEVTVISRTGLRSARLTNNTGIDDSHAAWTQPTMTDLRALVTRMDMTTGLRNSFLSTLDAAKSKLDAGDIAGAIAKLQAFQAQAEAERYGRLRLSQVDSLVGYADSLIVKVQATS